MKLVATISLAFLLSVNGFALTCLKGQADFGGRCGSVKNSGLCQACDVKTVDAHEVDGVVCPENEVMVGHGDSLICARLVGSCCGDPINRDVIDTMLYRPLK